MYKIINGESFEKLKEFEDNSIDSVVTDPPYGISFMNKKWDYEIPSKELWVEVLRVLKPGGHLLCACGTRTQHRMAVNIEDAGFEIRDIVSWLYGCLSEDTEILTKNGWERYHKNIDKSIVLAYNKEKNTFFFEKPIRSYFYENKHTAYRIQSDNTDQLVSRNHRVIVEQNGRKSVKYAEKLELEENIPFLESLSDLPEAIYDRESNTSVKKQVLLDKVLSKKEKETTEKKRNRSNLRNLWKKILKKKLLVKKVKKSFLFSKVQRNCKKSRIEETQLQRTKELDKRKRRKIKKENDREFKSCVERWSYLQKSKRFILKTKDKICSLSKKIFKYGEKGRICNGTSPFNGDKDRSCVIENGSSPSYKSQCRGQQNREFNAIQEQRRTQTIRSTRAKVTSVSYSGNVWCVTVPSGGFVARRNGKIFITGNSGFPKSHNIAKAVDKKLGNEREYIGEHKQPARNKRGGNILNMSIAGMPKKVIITKGNSKYEGWGTALKPAQELFTLARKPLSEKTVADNVLKWGTGGINIDDCRVSFVNEKDKGDPNRFIGTVPYPVEKGWNSNKLKCGVYNPQKGRFPANIIHDGSECVVKQFPNSKSSSKTKGCGKGGIWNKSIGIPAGDIYGDNGSAARFFYCAKPSKKERNIGLEGFEVKDTPHLGIDNWTKKHLSRFHTKQQNNHPTVKPIKLMKYLCRLITPKNGTVLDPFTGSGTTGIAAVQEDFSFIGIEREKEYCEISEARIEYASKQCKQLNLFGGQ